MALLALITSMMVSTTTASAAWSGSTQSPNIDTTIPPAPDFHLLTKREQSFATLNTLRKAHGSIMATCFVILLPLFALTIHLVPYSKTASRIHAPLQLTTLCLVIAGFGLGIHVEQAFYLTHEHHPAIGAVVVVYLIVFQPLMGYLHHRGFKKQNQQQLSEQDDQTTPTDTTVRGRIWWFLGHLHRWLGRAALILGMINGGLGLQLARKGMGDLGAPKSLLIAYGVVAGVVGVVYLSVVVGSNFVKARRSKVDSVSSPREMSQS